METEEILVDRVETLFLGGGYEIHREVPLLTRYIDLVARQPDQEEVVAVEAKVRNWLAGLRQAIVYRLAAGQVFLAISARHEGRVDLELLRSFGIGLIAVDGHADIVLQPKESPVIHNTLRDRLLLEIAVRDPDG